MTSKAVLLASESHAPESSVVESNVSNELSTLTRSNSAAKATGDARAFLYTRSNSRALLGVTTALDWPNLEPDGGTGGDAPDAATTATSAEGVGEPLPIKVAGAINGARLEEVLVLLAVSSSIMTRDLPGRATGA